MKKRIRPIIALTMAAALVLGLAACGGEEAPPTGDTDKVYEFKLGTTYKDPSTGTQFNSIGKAIQKFSADVQEKTDGSVVITPYYGGTLGGTLELFEQLRRGELEFFVGQPMSGVDKRFGALSLPYLFDGYDTVNKTIANPDSELFGLVKGWMDEYDLEMLAVGPGVFRGFANAKQPVRTVEDFDGLAVRIYQDPILQAFWEELALPTQLSFGEVYTALQTGTVDGMEFSPTGVLAYKISEVTDYYTDIDWQWTFGFPVLASDKYWDELPEELQAIVKECAIDAMAYQGEENQADLEMAYRALEESGLEVIRLTDEERQAFIDFAIELEPKFVEIIGEETYNEVTASIENAK